MHRDRPGAGEHRRRRSPNNFGFKNEQLGAVHRPGVVGGSDAIRVFALDPAIAAAELERSLSKFDARWISSMTWQKMDQPTAGAVPVVPEQPRRGHFSTTLAKPLPTGGVAGITFSTDYSKFAPPGAAAARFVNPNYTPRLQFSFEQPLLRLFGVEVNQLAAEPPRAASCSNVRPSGGQGTEGILITRIRLDQQKAEFEPQINYLLVNVETAYWNLYAAYYNLYAQEEGLRQAFEGYRFIQIRCRPGTSRRRTLDQARAQFERFRGQVYQARGQVLEAERQLRGLLGLRTDDGTRLVPIDEPNVAPYRPGLLRGGQRGAGQPPGTAPGPAGPEGPPAQPAPPEEPPPAGPAGSASTTSPGWAPGSTAASSPTPAGPSPGNALAQLRRTTTSTAGPSGFRLDMPLGFRDANAAGPRGRS